MDAVKLKQTKRGVRLVQHGTVLSEVLREPGATDSVFDVLAAGLQALAPGKEVALLGFAAGGMLAPLRAMGGTHHLHGVDLESKSFEIFQDLCGSWAGNLNFTCADALAWLKTIKRKFPVIMEDLSVPRDGDVFKPEISFDELPAQIHQNLKKDGLIIANLLPQPGKTWSQLRDPFVGDLPHAHEIHFDEFENRFIFAGSYGFSAMEISRRLRKLLDGIDSRLAYTIRVVTVR